MKLLAVQSMFVNSMYTMHDGFGILLSMGFLSSPFIESILLRYLFHHPQQLCYLDMAASIILFGKRLEHIMQTKPCISVIVQHHTDTVTEQVISVVLLFMYTATSL